MQSTYGIETPPACPSSEVGRWIDVWAWVVAFGLLLAAPCVPEPPGARGATPPPGVSAPPAGAPRPP